MHAAVTIILIGILFFVKAKIILNLEIDACLDAGGRYNYEKKVCENAINYVPLNERLLFKSLSIFLDIGILASVFVFYRGAKLMKNSKLNSTQKN